MTLQLTANHYNQDKLWQYVSLRAVALQAVAIHGDYHRSLRRKLSHAMPTTASYCTCKVLEAIVAIASYCMLLHLLQPIASQAIAGVAIYDIASYCKSLSGHFKPLLLLIALALRVSANIASYCIARH